MTILSEIMAGSTDEELWRTARAGDRAAFATIVERYQSLLCSVACGATGDLADSEDLAQEAFLVAWERLGELRDPAALRAWLCGIVRKLAAGTVRRSARRGGPAEPLDTIETPAAPDIDPCAAAVRGEEWALVRKALAGLPEPYREPLVLFYREQQSVAEVARLLELSEAAARQRLSRGRILLREELASVIERTLIRTRPGTKFTSAVLAGLGLLGSDRMGRASAAEAAATVSHASGLAGLLGKAGLGAVSGLATGLLTSWLAYLALGLVARSPEERRIQRRHAAPAVAFVLGMVAVLVAALGRAGTLYPATWTTVLLGVAVWTLVLVLVLQAIGTRMNRRLANLRGAPESGTPSRDAAL